MKKILFPLAIIVLIVIAASVGICQSMSRPQNIFDEMYQETKKTYRHNNILGEIEDIDVRSIWPSDSEYLKYTPHATYKEDSLPDTYQDIVLGFEFTESGQTSYIRLDKDINASVRVRIRAKYSYLEKSLTKTVQIILVQDDSDDYIDDETQVRFYLNEYGITADDLDSYYDDIINQLVLADWYSIYDSKYSPDDYGEVTVETQWEDW